MGNVWWERVVGGALKSHIIRNFDFSIFGYVFFPFLNMFLMFLDKFMG